MVCKIHECWLIRLSSVLDLQLVLVRQSVSNGRVESARIIFFPIFARVRQLEGRSIAGVDFFSLPDRLIESLAAAVQSVRVVVLRKLVLDTVGGESALSDSVAITTDQGAEVWRVADVV